MKTPFAAPTPHLNVDPETWQDLAVIPAPTAGLCHWCGICYEVEGPIKPLPESAGWGHPDCADIMWAQHYAAVRADDERAAS